MRAMELEMFVILLFLLIPIIILLTKKPSKKLPPGSMGLPVIGHSLDLIRALRTNKEEEWLKKRIRKYGPVSKCNLFGIPTIFLQGPAANKFIYTNDNNAFASNTPPSTRRILGEKNIFELSGEEHKRVRGALMSFLKPEGLKRYVKKIDQEVREHLEKHWHGQNEIIVSPLMKTLTFNIICSIIFGIEKGPRRDSLKGLSDQMMEGLLSIPVNLPFTYFRRSLRARSKIKSIISDFIHEKREALERYGDSSDQDLITCLLNSRRDGDTTALSDEEIVDSVIVILFGGHDTTANLITFLIRIFAIEPSTFVAVSQEQEQIAKGKHSGELLTWEDLVKMKHTWRVAMETLRMYPPVFGSFRRVVKDVEYDGYQLPKGWQVIWATSMTHMDEKIFKDPKEFKTTRFEEQPPPYSFVPFGGGVRICPGNEFAKIETLVLIHYLVTRFTWQLSSNDSSFWRNPLPVFKHGLPIRIVPKTTI